MVGKWYRLEGKEAALCENALEAAMHFENDNRNVRATETALHHISTVFLGHDHSHGRGGPLLFETMVFEKDETADARSRIQYDGQIGIMDRYATWDEAEAGHDRIHGEVLRLEQNALAAASFHKKPAVDG